MTNDWYKIERSENGYMMSAEGCGCWEEIKRHGIEGARDEITLSDLDELHANLVEQLELLLELREKLVLIGDNL